MLKNHKVSRLFIFIILIRFNVCIADIVKRNFSKKKIEIALIYIHVKNIFKLQCHNFFILFLFICVSHNFVLVHIFESWSIANMHAEKKRELKKGNCKDFANQERICWKYFWKDEILSLSIFFVGSFGIIAILSLFMEI